MIDTAQGFSNMMRAVQRATAVKALIAEEGSND